MIRRKLLRAAAWLLVCCLLPVSACASYWEEDSRDIGCRKEETDCLLLQMVMLGSFAQLDTTDNLSIRVLSAVLPRLTALDEEDFRHFLAEFEEDEALVKRCWEVAVGHCLWADILAEPRVDDERTQAARQVLLLFLEPTVTASAREQQATIRSQMTDDILAELAQAAGVTVSLAERLIYSDDWRSIEQ